MAISKKSLGKVLAISMASAMAMSSLSAALVSVSAVSPAALASNGSVQLNQEIDGASNILDASQGDLGTKDVEEAIQKILGADSDNHLDAITGGSINLANTITPVLSRTGYIQYTDSNGLKQDVEVDEISYRVTGGGAKLDANKTTLTAEGKGSATLTITVKGKVKLGGGKSDKSVTLKHTIDIDVHDANDYGLVAYRAGDSGNDIVTESDLNNLAAYGEDLHFSVIQYAAGHSNGFAVNRNLVEVGDGSGDGQSDKLSASKVISALQAAVDGLTDQQASAALKTAYKTAIKDKVEAKRIMEGTTPTNFIPANTTWASLGIEADLTHDVEAKKGYPVTIKAYGSVIETPAANYQGNNDAAPNAAWTTDTALYMAPNGTSTPIATGFLELEYDVDGATYYVLPSGTDISNLKQNTTPGDDTPASTYFTVNTLNGKVWQIGNTGESDEGKLSQSSGATADANHTAVDVYTLNDPKTVQMNGDIPYADEDTFATAVTALLNDATKNNLKIQQVGDNYYIAADEAASPDPVITDGSEELQKFFTSINAWSAEAIPGAEGTANGEAIAAVQAAFDEVMVPSTSGSADDVRFYAGTGEDLFDGVGVEWVKGTKGGNKGVSIPSGNDAVVNLKTNGTSGSGSVKVAVPGDNGKKDELVLNVKVVKAVDATGMGVTIKKSGSKTFIENDSTLTDEKNISGYEIRNAASLTVENGTIGKVVDIVGKIDVNGGRTGDIDSGDSAISVTEDGVVGNILSAASVEVDEGGRVGKITDVDGTVHLNEGTIDSIDVSGAVTIEGGTVTGDIKSEGNITITSDDEDSNDNPLDTVIGGNVIGSGKDAKITMDNQSDDGAAEISIGGYVLARYVDTDTNNDGTVSIGSADTTGPIRIKGAVEGEYVVLGGNGLLSLAGVRAANEIDHDDKDGETIESTLKFAGFNSVINSISNFANVVVDEGTVIVKGAVNATNLTVSSDAQIVADSMNIEEDIEESGSIVVPLGKLTVTGSVNDSPTLAFLGDAHADDLAFAGNRGLVNAFESGGLTFKAQRQADGNYNYLIEKVELGGLTAVGKDVAVGVGQTKTVSLALDGTLPEGASIEWSVDDSDVASVTGNGMTATITGKEIDATSVTAKIVDANGRDLGYEDANFEVNVLGVDTVDSIGGDIGPDDNELDLDTKKKNMEAGQVYTFMVRGNNDVENISVTSGDTNVATVALANGADSRGALYNITAVADGKTDITVTYQGKTSKIAVKVGGFQLDTSSKKMAPGQVYSVLAKNVPADQAGNVTLAYDSNIVDVVKVNDNYNGRGVLFNVTAKAIGETEVKVTHNGETETMAVNVVENTGRLTLDTASYTMPFGGSYTIGVKVEKNGRQLSGEEVRAMISSGELVVTDSRTGSIVTTEVQANGNVRVTGRQNEGTTYVQFIVMQNGQRVTHASVGVTVQNGATAGGSSVRSISQW